MFLIFDTETTGLPRNFKAPISDVDNWPRVIQLAWQLHDEDGKLVEHQDFLIEPEGFNIPYGSESIHGISTELALQSGHKLLDVLDAFSVAVKKADFIVGHNVNFDVNVLGCEFFRNQKNTDWTEIPVLNTCTEKTATLCQIKGGKGGKFKLPSLSELHLKLFGESFGDAHNATADVEATTRCFLELIRIGLFNSQELNKEDRYVSDFKKLNSRPFVPIGLKHLNLKKESEKIRKKLKSQTDSSLEINISEDQVKELEDYTFTHLHNHSQYSILQSTTQIPNLIEKCGEFDMHAVALTDSGNMMAAFHFESAANKYNKKIRAERENAEKENEPYRKKEILPIIGCEFNVCVDMNNHSQKDNGSRVVLLAKNKAGYQNLIKLASYAYTSGMYYVPRIDKELLLQYKSDLIVLSGGVLGEIPNLVLNVGEPQAENSLLWWKEHFDSDFYIEINRLGIEVEDRLNTSLIDLARKHEVKLVAANNSFYLNKTDAKAHDVLLCVKENQLVETEIGRGRGYRFGLENDEYYFKSSEEMVALFRDLPEALLSTKEIVDKCSHYHLERDVLLPEFDIPEKFIDAKDKEDGGKRGENSYLRHLVYEGAKQRYKEINDELKERIDFELDTIRNTGYPGYFLIVQDFCKA
ncbi:PHP domain-containing protein, partial [Crocinitomicaceae bacterium]|nr:PHP domain-containing protein [Crocinitomicaceae bacterium]